MLRPGPSVARKRTGSKDIFLTSVIETTSFLLRSVQGQLSSRLASGRRWKRLPRLTRKIEHKASIPPATGWSLSDLDQWLHRREKGYLRGTRMRSTYALAAWVSWPRAGHPLTAFASSARRARRGRGAGPGPCG